MPAADGRSYTKPALTQRTNAAHTERVRRAIKAIRSAAPPVMENERSKSATRTGAQPKQPQSIGASKPGWHPHKYFDFVVHPGKDGALHYPKGAGRLLDSPTRIAVRRMFSTKRTPAERAAALDQLQATHKLPSDSQIQALAAPKPVIPPSAPKPKKHGAGGLGGFLEKAAKTAGIAAIPGADIALGALGIGKAAKDVNDKLHLTRLASAYQGNPITREYEGIGGKISLPERVVNTAKHGILSTGSAALEGLDRPSAATESALAKGLVQVGAIHGKTAEKIRKAPGPGKVFLHGRDWRKDITGADITQGLGIGRKVGLGADIATDPLMYVGVGLAPETGGESLAPLLAKIRRIAPEVLHSEEAQKAFTAYHENKDAHALSKSLGDLIRPKALRQLHADRSSKIVKEALDRRHAQPFNITIPRRLARNGFKRSEITRDISVPSKEGVDAITHALSGAEARRVKAAVRLNLMTPTGKRLGHVPLVPEAIGKHIPLKAIRPAARKAMLVEAGRKAQTRLDEELRTHLNELDARIESARIHKDTVTVNKLVAQKAQLKDSYILNESQIRDLAKHELGGNAPAHVTLGDVVAKRNERLATHIGRVTADDYGRAVQQSFSHSLQDATRLLRGSPAAKRRSLERIQAHLIAEADTKGAGLADLHRAINLTPTEEKVAQNLRTIHAAQLEHGLQTGVIKSGLEGYVGLRLWKRMHDPEEISKEIQNIAHGKASTTGFQRHRTVPAVADYASRSGWVDALTRLKDHGIQLSNQDALHIADALHAKGTVRSMSELTARRLQRSEHVLWQDITPTERAAIDRASRTGLLPDQELPLFRTPLLDPTTEGHVLPANFEHYGLTEDLHNLPAGERQLAHLHSLVKDRAQVQAMLSGMPEGQAAEDLRHIEQRLTTDINAVDPSYGAAETARTAEHAGLNNLLKARTAQTDKQLADLEIQRTAKGPAVTVPHVLPDWTEDGQDLVRQLPDGRRQDIVKMSSTYRVDLSTPVGEEITKGVTGYAGAAAHTISPARLRSLTKAKEFADQWAHEHLGPAVTEPPKVMSARSFAAKRNAILKAEGRDMKDTRSRIIALEQGMKEPLPEEPGNFTQLLDRNGDSWLRGPQSHEDPPIEGITPRSSGEAGPLDDPFDYTDRLPDWRRQDHTMVELDPRVTGYYRNRSQGLVSAFHARWQAVDRLKGRSLNEYYDRVYTNVATGEHGFARDLRTVRDTNGNVTHYEDHVSGEEFNPDELHFPEPTLIPNSSKDIWLDTAENTEYLPAREQLGTTLMAQEIGADRLWPAQAIDSLKAEMGAHGEYDQIYDVGMNHGWQRLMSQIRFGVTTPFPAYHVRNLISDMLKSIQADSGVLFHPIVNAKLTMAAFNRGLGHTIKFPGYGKMTVADFLFVSEMFGVRSGHHVAEVAQLMKEGEFTDKRIVAIHQKYNPFHAGGWTTKAGAHREDIVRYVTFMQRMRANGGDAAEASWYMIRHHFNFNDLTIGEKRYVRNAFLFYTWYRKNIPLQLVELARRPGFFAGIAHTYNETAANAPVQPALPSYLRDKLQSITTNWNGYALNTGFGAPWSDLQFVSSGGLVDAMGTLTNPVVGLGLSYGYGIEPLTGRSYKKNEPSGSANILDELDRLTGGKGLHKDENGNPTLPWALSVFLRQVPLLGRASSSFQDVSGVRDQGRLQRYGQLLSPLTGLNVYVSPKPGSGREGVAIVKAIQARIGERRQLQIALSNEDPTGKYYKGQVEKFDKETLRWARERGIEKWLSKVQQSGFYVRGSGRKARGVTLGSTAGSGLHMGTGSSSGGVHLP